MDKPLRAWTAQTWHSFINFLEPSSLFYIALLSSLAATMILWYGFSPILVSIPVLLLSTIFISSIFSKRKVVTAAAVEEEEEEAKERPSEGSETMVAAVVPELCVAEKTDNEACELHVYQVDSTEFPSDDESSSDDSLRSEIFELKWMKPFNNNVGLMNRNPRFKGFACNSQARARACPKFESAVGISPRNTPQACNVGDKDDIVVLNNNSYRNNSVEKEIVNSSDEECQTPKSAEFKIPAILSCPPPPRKPKSTAISFKRKLVSELAFIDVVLRSGFQLAKDQ